MRTTLDVPLRSAPSGFPVFEPPPGAPIVPDEVVARYRDDDPANG